VSLSEECKEILIKKIAMKCIIDMENNSQLMKPGLLGSPSELIDS
jgi:hypothetical protein